MLSSSIRRVVRTPVAVAPLSTISRTATQSSSRRAAPSSPSAAAAVGVRHVHQRRYSSSSSKPPVPPSDGSRRIDASSSQAPSTKSVRPSEEKGKEKEKEKEKRESRSARRRGGGKDGNNRSNNGSSSKTTPTTQDVAFANLPSVPSTQHVQPHDVHIASFFSIHRPISVTNTVPLPSSAQAFNAIFTPKQSSRSEPGDVIDTLSAAVDSMESAAHHSVGEQHEEVLSNILNGNATGLSTSFGGPDTDTAGHVGGLNMGELRVSLEDYARRLRPFQPPPAPVPLNNSEQHHQQTSGSEGADVDADVASSSSKQTSSYSTVLTIRESTHADGRKTYEAHTGPFVPTDEMEAPAAYNNDTDVSIVDISPSSSPSMTHHRGVITYRDRTLNNRTMHAISTKRRRKLKMKKHKFKKLMRRTRTLRRKLDKA